MDELNGYVFYCDDSISTIAYTPTHDAFLPIVLTPFEASILPSTNALLIRIHYIDIFMTNKGSIFQLSFNKFPRDISILLSSLNLSLLDFRDNFTISFMSLALSFRIQLFLDHMVAYVVSFDSHVWTLKSDIIRPHYKLFNAYGRSCLSLPYL